MSDIKKNGFTTKESFLQRCSFSGGSQAIDKILSLNLLIPGGHFDAQNRYSRNALYYSYNGADSALIQSKLSQKHVTLIGCGGIGTMLAYFLATSGVGHLTLVDHDHIELSNLTRQVLFTEKDVGKQKIDILKKELLKRNNHTNIDTQTLNISSAQDVTSLKKSDLFIVSADSPFGLVDWINSYCVKAKQPYVNVGYINDIAVIGPFYIPGKTACLACQQLAPDYQGESEDHRICKEINKNFKAATFPAINGIAASYAFADIMRYLGEYGNILSINRRVGIHSMEPRFEFQILEKQPNCPVCSKILKK